MAQAGTITALLKLNSSGFQTGLDNAIKSLNQFEANANKLPATLSKLESTIVSLDRILGDNQAKITAINNALANTKNFNAFATAINNIAKAMRTLSSSEVNVEMGMNTITNMFRMFQSVLNGTEVTIKGVVSSVQQLSAVESEEAVVTEQVAVATKQYASALEIALPPSRSLITNNVELANAERQVSASSTQASSSIQRQASANRSATSSTQQLTSATNGLKNALSSLKMVGTLVASMMVWNFASSLVTATRETVNAKSEMEGYFKMLGFAQSEVDDFNKALDDTVRQFQRVNKYSLGETISSIGVEFNLTTDEMKQAMKVTSMITSEYLRAGRNANEASLAVKDVLQGQFQRLSRETGVKGEQLKEAGWSGDTNDVMGLMKALEKVAEDRNWDVFAMKANSLNDIVTILQNRFGEWSADMVYAVQPSIVNAFNTIMSVAGMFGNVLGGIWEWLNTDGIAQNIIKWTGLATAITGVISALVVYRTGANLTQIVQMGLRGSIIATTLGLEAETVATYGSRTAIISRITSLEAEKVSTMSVRQAIASKILGLNAEKVAQFGLKGSIVESIFAREYEQAVQKGANVTELESIALKYKEIEANLSTSQSILARIFGLNAETLAQKGTIVALAERIASSPLYIGSLEAEEVAELSTAEASLILAGTLAPLIAIFVGLAVAVYSVVKPLQDASEQMKKFNDLVNNGDDAIKSARDTMNSYNAKASKLNDELNQLTKGTAEYTRKEKELEAVNKDLQTSTSNLANITKAVEMARSSQTKFNTRLTEIQIETQTKLADSYIKAGLSAQEANELASHELNDAKKGANQLREAINRIKWEADIGAKKHGAVVDMLKAYGLDDESIKKYGTNMSEARAKITEGFEKFMTSDDLMDRIGGWLEIQQGRLEEWWTEFNALFEVRDWEGMRDKLVEGIKYVLSGFGAFDWMSALSETIDKKGFIGAIQEFIWGEGDSDGAWDIIADWGNSMIVKPLCDWLNWFIQDPAGHLGEMQDDFSLAFAKFLFGSDTDVPMYEIVEQWAYNTFVKPVVDWLNNFISDPIGVIGSGGFSFGGIGALTFALPQLLFGEGTNLDQINQWINTWVDQNIMIPLGSAFYNGIMSIPLVSDILQLFGLVNGDNSGASQKGSDIGNAFKTKVEEVIRNIPIVGDIAQILGLIPQQNSNARDKGHGIGQNIKDGEKSGQNGLADQVRTEIGNIIDILTKKVGEVYQKAWDIGNNIVKGVKDAMDMHSPSIISRELLPKEFGVYIPQAISDNASTVYDSAYQYGMAIRDGISSVNTDFSMGGVADEYQQDAQIISTYSQMMGMDTTTAFNDMSLAVNDTTNTMATNVTTSYSTMQQKQQSLLNNMKSSNTTAYNEMYQKSNQSLLQMRDSTSNITNQMINAWSHMKTQLVATANALRSESTNHFNQLSNTIGSFYRKIQNPSSWGSAGSPTMSSAPKRRVGRAVASSLGASGGRNSWKGGSTMSIGSLKRQICPNGDCGDLFDGYTATDIVDVATFLSMADGSFGWNGWNRTHYNHIKNKSDQWDMKSPIINLVGGIQTNSKFKVGEFNNGQPRISFSSFQGMAESIFSAIPYRFYYDSSWKGSWLGALQSGACNCYDGASALIAFANSCGFSGYMQHGTWTDADGSTYGHVWAVIDGKKMDTTGWQQRGTWTPSSSAGSPMRTTSVKSGDEIHIHIDMSNSTNYGVDNIEEIVEEGVKKGLREQFSNPVTVRI